MSTLTYRWMSDADIPALIPLAQRIWRAHYPSIISVEQIEHMLAQWYNAQAIAKLMQGGQRFFLALDGKTMIGFAAATPLANMKNETLRGSEVGAQDWFMNKCYVAPELKGKGTGSALLAALEKELAPTRMRLQVARANTGSWNFYLKRGFTIEREYDFPIGDGYYMLDYVMEKRYG